MGTTTAAITTAHPKKRHYSEYESDDQDTPTTEEYERDEEADPNMKRS
jgi:hypothetical protein